LHHAHRDVAHKRVAVDPNHLVALLCGHRWHVVSEVIIVCSTGQFYMGPFSHTNINITQNRVCLDFEMGGCAVGVDQIDSHVAEYGDGDQFILDIPGSGSGTFV